MRWPILHLHIEVPFILIDTRLMYQRYENYIYEYVMLHIQIWHWRFEIGLYRSDRDGFERRR